MTKKKPIRLCSVLGESLDLLPHFIKHYKEIGVEKFDFILHLIKSDDPFREKAMDLLSDYRIEPSEIFVGQWNGYRGTKLLNKIKLKYPDEWFVVADSDEFHIYCDSLSKIIENLCGRRLNFVTGCLLDRVSKTGELIPVKAKPNLWLQFPVAGFVSFPMMKANPFKITFCQGKTILSEGQHGVTVSGMNYPVWGKVTAQVHHFKWSSNLLNKIKKRIESIEALHWEDAYKGYGEESKRLIRYFYQNNGKFDLDEPKFLFETFRSAKGNYKYWQQVLERTSSWDKLQSSPCITY